MKALRTPDEGFSNLPGHSFEPHDEAFSDGEDGVSRIHYVDEGQSVAEVVLLMHGERHGLFSTEG
jgi:haloalkane dehalogenase